MQLATLLLATSTATCIPLDDLTRDVGDLDAGDVVVDAGNGDAGGDACSSNYRATVLADSPAAYWRFGESTGASLAKDEVDGGSGAAYGAQGLTFGAPGAIACDPDTALYLDGTGGVDAGPGFDFPGDQPFSLEMWLKPYTVDTTHRRLFEHVTFDAMSAKDGYTVSNQIVHGVSITRVSNRTAHAVAAPAIAAGDYHHLVATYDATGIRIYVDGALHRTGAPQALASIDAPLVIGAALANPKIGGFIGAIDEVAIYRRALPADRISAHHDAGRRR